MSSKFLIVMGHYGHMGGAERQAFHLIRHLREKLDEHVSVLGWYGEGPLVKPLHDLGCEVFHFPYKEKVSRLSKARNLLRLAMFIRMKIRPDFILPFVSINSKPICQIWRLTGARYAWWNQQDEGRSLFGTKVEKSALKNASGITSNSWAGTQFLSTTYEIPEDKIFTYNNGTPLPDCASLKPMWRKKLCICETTQLVSMLANITPFKDHETLLKAWMLVLQQFKRESKPPPFLALAGFTKQTKHVNALKVLAFDLKLGNSVEFIGATDETNELMFESDLVVHSSNTEGCPNSVCEAMALGKSVVGTDIPGMRQALDRELWNDCLSNPGDPHSLAAKILRFLGDNSFAQKVGSVNRERIRNHFSIEGMCEALLSQIDSYAK